MYRCINCHNSPSNRFDSGLGNWFTDVVGGVQSALSRVQAATGSAQRVATAAGNAASPQPVGNPTGGLIAAPEPAMPSWLLPAAIGLAAVVVLPRLLKSARR